MAPNVTHKSNKKVVYRSVSIVMLSVVCTESHVCFIVMQSFIVLSVVILSVVAPNVTHQSNK